LVTGASQGAKSINEAVIAILPFLKSCANWQVLHLTGEKDHPFVADAYRGSGLAAKVVSYTEHMAEAVAAADIVVARAGASTLAELTAVGRAAVLMPYPFHRDQHQMTNAECLARVGAARIVRDAVAPAVNARALQSALAELMNDDAARAAMAGAALRLGRRDAAEKIAESLFELAELTSEKCLARIGAGDLSTHPIITKSALANH
jgi:UDP-N-acetylglucosamine--N-acetylmuramyl-(pentapeptide) pyrophosphoryl-undecaprenol N-acetylglucosamine transferase